MVNSCKNKHTNENSVTTTENSDKAHLGCVSI